MNVEFGLVQKATSLEEFKQNGLNVEELDLSSHELTDQEVVELASRLQTNRTLKKLNLSKSRATDVIIQQLVQVFAVNRTLVKLDLHDAELADREVTKLAKVLRGGVNALRELNLGWNSITDKGASALAEALKKNHTLQSLDLSGNDIAEIGTKALAQSFTANIMLTKLYLTSGESSLTEKICQYTRRNSCIQHKLTNFTKYRKQGNCDSAKRCKEEVIQLAKKNGVNKIGLTFLKSELAKVETSVSEFDSYKKPKPKESRVGSFLEVGSAVSFFSEVQSITTTSPHQGDSALTETQSGASAIFSPAPSSVSPLNLMASPEPYEELRQRELTDEERRCIVEETALAIEGQLQETLAQMQMQVAYCSHSSRQVSDFPYSPEIMENLQLLKDNPYLLKEILQRLSELDKNLQENNRKMASVAQEWKSKLGELEEKTKNSLHQWNAFGLGGMTKQEAEERIKFLGDCRLRTYYYTLARETANMIFSYRALSEKVKAKPVHINKVAAILPAIGAAGEMATSVPIFGVIGKVLSFGLKELDKKIQSEANRRVRYFLDNANPQEAGFYIAHQMTLRYAEQIKLLGKNPEFEKTAKKECEKLAQYTPIRMVEYITHSSDGNTRTRVSLLAGQRVSKDPRCAADCEVIDISRLLRGLWELVIGVRHISVREGDGGIIAKPLTEGIAYKKLKCNGLEWTVQGIYAKTGIRIDNSFYSNDLLNKGSFFSSREYVNSKGTPTNTTKYGYMTGFFEEVSLQGLQEEVSLQGLQSGQLPKGLVERKNTIYSGSQGEDERISIIEKSIKKNTASAAFAESTRTQIIEVTQEVHNLCDRIEQLEKICRKQMEQIVKLQEIVTITQESKKKVA